MATYPAALITFTTKTNQVDLVDAAHINTAQDEIVAIQTELGTDPAGSATNLKTRLAVSIGDDGAIRKGTSFPGSPIDGQAFYRTDEDTFYIYNGTSWISNTNLGNLAWSWGFQDDAGSGTSYGSKLTAFLAESEPASLSYFSLFNKTTTYQILKRGKYRKIAGPTTITVWCRMAISTGTGYVQVNVGGQTVILTTTNTSPEWQSGNIDISGLVNGTTYDITWEVTCSAVNNACHLYWSYGILG